MMMGALVFVDVFAGIMTIIRWTEPANADFLGIIEWLNARAPAAAAMVGRLILDTVEMLNHHPYSGQAGPLAGHAGTGRRQLSISGCL
jgi:plasmid stabilization system protein ParE